MKTLIVALLLVSGSSAFANKFAEVENYEYLSYCSEEKVSARTDKGVEYVVADCASQGLVCKQTARKYSFDSEYKTVIASCVKAK